MEGVTQSPETHSAYVRKAGKIIGRILRKPPNHFSDEDYHKLRVEIKKLKAVAGFIAFARDSFDKQKQLKPFSKIYNQAGRIRELQLEEAFLAQKYESLPQDYLHKLSNKIKKFRKKFRRLVSKKRRRKITKAVSSLEKRLLETGHNDAVRFMNREKARMDLLVRQLPLEPQKAHRLRKMLKEDYYNRKRMDWPSTKIPAEDELLEVLGKWHDMVVLNELISVLMVKAANQPEEMNELKKINAGVATSRQVLFDEVNALLGRGVL